MCRRSVILALGRLRLDAKFEASPDYTSTKPAWVAENDLAGGDAGRGGMRVEFTEYAQKWPKQKTGSQTKSHRMTCNADVSLFPRMPNKIQDT